MNDKQVVHELTAGIEVHQQLSTSKLFCSCPSTIRDGAPDVQIERQLRAAAGESGEMDIAARHEQHKAKRFNYQGYQDTTCLVELDEEPVSAPNAQAVVVALQVARMLSMTLVDEVHVMRKTVVDGSNTSGFQRTMLVARDGNIEVNGNKVRIEQLCLEEDSCKLVERGERHDTYNLSRLGIPLLEITTGPDLHTAEDVKATAAYIGMLLRSTEQVKRGLGTTRQDVNVSVPGGVRVEVKGVQDLASMGLIVKNEAQRQRILINLALVIPAQAYSVIDVTSALKTLPTGFIRKAIDSGQSVLGLRLAGWKENLAAELQPGTRLGKELAGYAKAHGFGGLVHSSEDASKYGFTSELVILRSLLNSGDDDAWLLMVGVPGRLLPFFDNVLIPRLHQLSIGVPAEVRKPEADGTNSYLRPMPGAARMYPETDVRAFQPKPDSIALPELITHKATRLAKQYGLHADLATQISKEGLGTILEGWIARFPNIQPGTLAALLTAKEREIKTRHGIDVDVVLLAPEFLPALNAGEITLAAVEDILVSLAKGEPLDMSKYKAVSETELSLAVSALIAENPSASQGVLMGKVMRHFNGRADGKKVQELIARAGVRQ